MLCPDCKGKGALVTVQPKPRAVPAYWFHAGAFTCVRCDGTGEIDEGKPTAP